MHNHTIAHRTNGVSTCPTLRGADIWVTEKENETKELRMNNCASRNASLAQAPCTANSGTAKFMKCFTFTACDNKLFLWDANRCRQGITVKFLCEGILNISGKSTAFSLNGIVSAFYWQIPRNQLNHFWSMMLDVLVQSSSSYTIIAWLANMTEAEYQHLLVSTLGGAEGCVTVCGKMPAHDSRELCGELFFYVLKIEKKKKQHYFLITTANYAMKQNNEKRPKSDRYRAGMGK